MPRRPSSSTDAAVVDRAADDPVPRRQRVAEDAAARVDCGGLDGDPQRAAGADRAGRDAGAHRAEAEVGHRPVAGTDDHRRGRRSSPSRRRPPAEARTGVVGHQRRQRSRRRRPSRAPPGPKTACRSRAARCRRRPTGRRPRAGSRAPRAPDAGPAPRPRRTSRARARRTRRAWAAATSGEPACRSAGAAPGAGPQPFGLLGRPRVGPGQGGVSGPPPCVEADQGVHRAAERQRGDPAPAVRTPDTAARTAASTPRPDRGSCSARRAGLEQRVAGLRAQLAAVGVEGDRLGAGRPDVDAEDDGRRAVHAAKHASRACGFPAGGRRALTDGAAAAWAFNRPNAVSREGSLRCRSTWRPTSRRPWPNSRAGQVGHAQALAEIRDEVRAQRAEASRVYRGFAFFAGPRSSSRSPTSSRWR